MFLSTPIDETSFYLKIFLKRFQDMTSRKKLFMYLFDLHIT